MPGTRTGTGDDDEERAIGRSYVCSAYELRITRRCLTDDLDMDQGAEFVEACRHPIVTAFRNQRKDTPVGSKTVGPTAGDDTIHRLGHTDDHRGATWHDTANDVVWLCAYRLHRSGESDDAFPYFLRLIESGQIKPGTADYEALRDDRADRLADALPHDAQQLLETAKQNPECEVVGQLGELTVGVLVVTYDGLEEIVVCIAGAHARGHQALVLKALFPDSEFGEWTVEYKIGDRPIDVERYEACWSILHCL